MTWEARKLGEVAYLAGRIGWKGLTAKEYTKNGPLFTSVHSLNHGDYVDFSEAFHITQERYDESPEIMLDANDILICKDGAGIGKLGIVGDLPGPATINSSLLLIRALQGVEPKFLYHALSSPSFQKVVKEKIDGATTPHLYQREIREFSVFIPPLAEQKRIVAILDETFEGIDTAVADAKKNLTNARELFSSYVAALFESGDGDWSDTNLSAEVDLQTGFAFRSQNYTSDMEGIRLLRGDNIVQGELRWDDVKRWPSSDRAAYREYELEENDIVLAMDRTWVKAGIKFARILRDDVPALLVQRVARMRCRKTLSDGLLFYILGSRLFEKYVLEIQTGLGVPHISGKQIQAFHFRMPSIVGQSRTVEKLDAMRTHCETLVTNYQNKVTLFDALRQSILQKAFAGELTAQRQKAALEAAE